MPRRGGRPRALARECADACLGRAPRGGAGGPRRPFPALSAPPGGPGPVEVRGGGFLSSSSGTATGGGVRA